VVTPEFKSQAGLFKVHTNKGKVLVEIPKGELEKDLLLVVQIKKSPSGTSYPGQSVEDLVVRWQLRENKVLLRAVSYANIADPNNPISRAVDAMNTATIIMAFPVEAYAADGAPVVDATKLFTSDVNEIPVKKLISDPRSGEILEADVEVYHNVQQLARDWYWTQVGPLDPRCKTLPVPDEVMGKILLYVVTHEVGHSLGLPHNFKASATYPIEKIRDKAIKAADTVTKTHLEDLRDQITMILEPKK
jgi:hypothetical protein